MPCYWRVAMGPRAQGLQGNWRLLTRRWRQDAAQEYGPASSTAPAASTRHAKSTAQLLPHARMRESTCSALRVRSRRRCHRAAQEYQAVPCYSRVAAGPRAKGLQGNWLLLTCRRRQDAAQECGPASSSSLAASTCRAKRYDANPQLSTGSASSGAPKAAGTDLPANCTDARSSQWRGWPLGHFLVVWMAGRLGRRLAPTRMVAQPPGPPRSPGAVGDHPSGRPRSPWPLCTWVAGPARISLGLLAVWTAGPGRLGRRLILARLAARPPPGRLGGRSPGAAPGPNADGRSATRAASVTRGGR